jgi:hypothetical protein
MGKTTRVYVGLINIYFCFVYKRGLFGIIALISANILAIFVLEATILRIIKTFCFLCILMVFFIDYKNEKELFKILHISVFSQKLVKLAIVVPLELLQLILFILLNNDKII